jgi:hypothetical protein
MPQQWIVEHTDDYGVIHRFQYDQGRLAKDVADDTWEDYKHKPGHAVKVYIQQRPEGPRTLVYTAGQR